MRKSNQTQLGTSRNTESQIPNRPISKRVQKSLEANNYIPDPTKPIDPQQVKELASYGCSKRDIATLLLTTIDKVEEFSYAFDYGLAETKMRLKRVQLDAAYNGNTQMQIWLGKNLLGQTDKQLEYTDTIEEVEFEVIQPIIGD